MSDGACVWRCYNRHHDPSRAVCQHRLVHQGVLRFRRHKVEPWRRVGHPVWPGLHLQHHGVQLRHLQDAEERVHQCPQLRLRHPIVRCVVVWRNFRCLGILLDGASHTLPSGCNWGFNVAFNDDCAFAKRAAEAGEEPVEYVRAARVQSGLRPRSLTCLCCAA